METELLDSLRRARDGDESAFQPIVERYSKPLWRAAWRVLGDPEAAEDAVQEAFLRITSYNVCYTKLLRALYNRCLL